MPDSASAIRGRLIVMEGADGSGKTTLAHELVSHLKSRGMPVEYFSFPGREAGTLGAEVYALHHNSRERGIESIHPASLQLLHIAAHIDAIESKLLPTLLRGTHVVLDRYWWSTWVYGIVGGASAASLKAMIDVELCHWGDIRPDMAFLITRAKARADDIAVERSHRIQEYHRLAAFERNDYPVRFIDNDSSISEAITKIAFELKFPGWEDFGAPTCGSSSRQHQDGLSEVGRTMVGPQIFSRLAPARPTAVYDTYWRFACERQRIFFARVSGKQWPWTDDPVLREYKFTNAYRASDRVSQYLIREVIYRGDSAPDEVFFRTLLFKVFNRIETWELLRREFGSISYGDFSFKRYSRTLDEAMSRGQRIYSAAYIMPSGGVKNPGGRKHAMHLLLIERMMKEGLPKKVGDARSMARAFELLRSYPTIGDFLAYQYVTDLNYGPLTSFSEMEFVVPGPGAFSGIHKCFSDLGGLTEAEIIKVITERQHEEFQRLGLAFPSLWGRPLQLIDCQNLFCEVDKYARVRHPEIAGKTGRTRIKQRFVTNTTSIPFWYPPKWGLNDLIKKGAPNV